jgi:hypothetical protein
LESKFFPTFVAIRKHLIRSETASCSKIFLTVGFGVISNRSDFMVIALQLYVLQHGSLYTIILENYRFTSPVTPRSVKKAGDVN